jgi:hypothetical protein
MRQPDVAKKPIVALLVQHERPAAAETHVDFAVAVEVGGVVPRAALIVEVEDGAFADVDEEADVFTAPEREGLAN